MTAHKEILTNIRNYKPKQIEEVTFPTSGDRPICLDREYDPVHYVDCRICKVKGECVRLNINKRIRERQQR